MKGELMEVSNLFKKIEGTKAVLVFTSENCMPCKMLLKSIDKIKEDYDFVFVTISTDEFPNTAGFFQVASVPRMIFVKEGIQVNWYSGNPPLKKLKELFNKFEAK